MKWVLDFLGLGVYISRNKSSCHFLKNLQVPNFVFFYNISIIKPHFGGRGEITVFFLRFTQTSRYLEYSPKQPNFDQTVTCDPPWAVDISHGAIFAYELYQTQFTPVLSTEVIEEKEVAVPEGLHSFPGQL